MTKMLRYNITYLKMNLNYVFLNFYLTELNVTCDFVIED